MWALIPLSIITSIFNGLLGSYGGAQNTSKSWRRIGIPLVWMVHLGIATHSPWVLFIMLQSIGLGYGIPDSGDEGSAIGGFWYRLGKGNTTFADIMTRASVASIRCTMLIFIPLLTGSWMMYGIGSFIYILGNVLFGGNAIIRNEGMFRLFGKDLLWEEFAIHSINSVAVLIMLYGGQLWNG